MMESLRSDPFPMYELQPTMQVFSVEPCRARNSFFHSRNLWVTLLSFTVVICW